MPLKTIAAIAALFMSVPCFAMDGASFELGGGDQVRMLRLGVQSNWQRRWFESNGTHVGGHWNATIGQWRASAWQHVADQRQNITVIGLGPEFRLQSDDLRGWYAEGGVGANLLSKLYENNGDHLSTSFQFNDHLGAGYVFRNGWDLGLKFEHFSNGGIKEPNSGVNFMLVRLAYQF